MGEKEGKSLVASFSFAPYDGIWFCCFVFFLYIDSSLNMRSNCGAEARRHGGSPRTEAGWFCLQTGRAQTLPKNNALCRTFQISFLETHLLLLLHGKSLEQVLFVRKPKDNS